MATQLAKLLPRDAEPMANQDLFFHELPKPCFDETTKIINNQRKRFCSTTFFYLYLFIEPVSLWPLEDEAHALSIVLVYGLQYAAQLFTQHWYK